MATAPTRLPDAAVATPVPSTVDAMRPIVCRVVSVARELKDVTTLVLEPPADRTPFIFRPGQFNMERPGNLIHQFYEKHSFDGERVINGLKLMALGFFKKIVIADKLAILVERVYADPSQYTGLPLIVA